MVGNNQQKFHRVNTDTSPFQGLMVTQTRALLYKGTYEAHRETILGLQKLPPTLTVNALVVHTMVLTTVLLAIIHTTTCTTTLLRMIRTATHTAIIHTTMIHTTTIHTMTIPTTTLHPTTIHTMTIPTTTLHSTTISLSTTPPAFLSMPIVMAEFPTVIPIIRGPIIPTREIIIHRTAGGAIQKITQIIPLTTAPVTTRVDDIPGRSTKQGNQFGKPPWNQGCDVFTATACDLDTGILSPP